ncbi:MAG: DUF3160 domain-containing protein [Deltaproteobacteria bacterium]|jgi:hypothetical protein|nr:DUF3160 domain-containing protein [Deltaproteobacteria bacterium]
MTAVTKPAKPPSSRRRPSASFGAAALAALAAALLSSSAGARAQSPSVPAAPAPAFSESAFDAKSAWNWKAVSKEYGPFSAEQVARLNRDRFLVVPQKEGKELPGDYMSERFDDMLSYFDGLGGPYDPAERDPQHARFVGPDVVLHAFHKYFSERLKEAETSTLSFHVQAMLAGFYDNALALRAQAPEGARAAWDLALAQMAVPLAIIETRPPEAASEPGSWETPPEGTESVGDALAAFSAREGDLPEALRAAARAALAAVYAAEAPAGGEDPAKALGLAPAYNSERTDWTQFLPRSHYALNSKSRAYFRALVWLGQLGWKRDDPAALPSLVAWTAAMAGPGGAGFEKAKANYRKGDPSLPPSPARAWWALYQVSVAFVGFYDDPSLREALELAASGGSYPGAGAPADEAFLAGLGPRMGLVVAQPAGFFEFRKGGYKGKGVITVLPQRFTVPWLLASELTAEAAQSRGGETALPVRFSGLYLAWALGSAYAGELSGRQIASAQDGDLAAPLSAMFAKAGELYAGMGKVPLSDWGSSIGGAWFNALRSFSRSYGEGYPLYMRSAPFAAKQLETLMGSWTELKHDTLLYEKPNYGSEGGDGGDERKAKRLPKGFVEPNMDFWAGMLAALDVMRDSFKRNGLFPDEAEDGGRLASFRADVERLAGIAARELSGASISEGDYEFVRTFHLQGLARRPGGSGGEESLSALAADVQTVTDGNAGVVHEGLGAPSLMLVLVGNDGEKRVTVGMAYNHYEFFVSPVARIADGPWKAVAYRGLPDGRDVESAPAPELPALPPKPFWYDPLYK